MISKALISLVYVSSAAEAFSEGDLLKLLERSRVTNERLGITGLLLYQDGNILQVLEGPEEVVRDVFEKISYDGRHRGVIRLLEQPIEARQFPDWSMAFRNLYDPEIRKLPGFSEFLNEKLDPSHLSKNPNRVTRLLDIFRRNVVHQ